MAKPNVQKSEKNTPMAHNSSSGDAATAATAQSKKATGVKTQAIASQLGNKAPSLKTGSSSSASLLASSKRNSENSAVNGPVVRNMTGPNK